MVILWLGGAFVFLFLFFLWSSRPQARGSALGLDGELLFADKGRASKAFVSMKYGVRAKPDFLIRLADGRVALVEYKSRNSDRVYESDIVQAKVSALAARVAYPVETVFVKTKRRLQEFPIPRSDDALYGQVKEYVELARRAEQGELLCVFTSNLYQCKTCSVRSSCQR